MRNLKRALSLALASVMLLGMMVVGSSAKGIDDFTDKAEIVNQDAVAVTSAIGMFEGYEDGSFGPENVVTRAEMAVIICTMLYGAGVNVNQFAETNVHRRPRLGAGLCEPVQPGHRGRRGRRQVRSQRHRDHRAGRADAVPRPGLLPERR